MTTAKRKVVEWFFIGAACLELMMGVLHHTGYTITGTRYILWVLFLVYCLTAFTQKLSKKEVLIFLICEVIGVLLFWNSGVNTGIKMPVFMLACKGIDLKKLVTWLSRVFLLLFSFIFIMSFVSGTYESSLVTKKGFIGRCLLFGFTNPNVCQFMVTFLLLFFFYRLNKSMKLWIRVVLFVIMMSFILCTGSKTGLLVGLLLFIFFSVAAYCKNTDIGKLLLVLQVLFLAFAVCVSLMASFHCDNPLLNRIGFLITGRTTQLEELNNVSGTYPNGYAENWRLFSTKMNKNFYDLGYAHIFYYYGIIPAILYVSYVCYGFMKAWRKRDCISQIAILICSIYVFMESLMFTNYLMIDFLFLFSTIAIWRDKQVNAS